MIEVKKFYDCLEKNNISFFTGVPDSLLKYFCAYIKDNVSDDKNIVAANEGNAVAIASGYYLATGNFGLVYMQNSGLGNALNPLVSLNDELVYNIPILLLVGWRGEPDKKDEPQHKKQGLITIETLELLNIKYKIIDENTSNDDIEKIICESALYMKETCKPFGIVVRKNTFSQYKLNNIDTKLNMSREEALEVVIDNMQNTSVIVSTTGMISRELFELREQKYQNHKKDFLTVGSMGHASQIALGIALSKKNRDVYCFDGDGAMIMHLGGIAIIGSKKLKNFKHILFNNGAHDSVGGQDTAGLEINIPDIAKACGYKSVYSCSTKEELIKYSKLIEKEEGAVLLEIKVRKGARENLGRPTKTPIENKNEFMEFLNN